MLPKLSYFPINTRNYKIGVLAVGLIYIIFKNYKIQKFMRRALNTFKLKKNVTLVISSKSDVKVGVDTLRRKLSETHMLGLDCEWVSTNGKRQPVALLQLAAPDGFCSLFRLCHLNAIPTELVNLLEDKSVLKVGVAVVTDARYLYSDYGVKCAGCLDLRHLAAQVDVETKGLAGLAHDLFGIEMDKNWRVRCSDWEAETLSPQQIQYAAKDACVAVDIFNELNHKAICKKYSLWKRLLWSKRDYWQHSYDLWLPYVGLNFKEKSRGGGGSARRVNHADVVFKRNYCTFLQKEHYSNIFLLAPDDQVLCTISKTKADWYIEKELVDILDPKTLRLKFEPSRRSNDPENYYTKPKDNRCVVCGSDKTLRRKNIVPLEYRKHFDEKLKNHNSHDVLLLCFPCHNRSNTYDQNLRERLAVECDAPLAEGKNSKLQELPDVRAVRSAARALYYNGSVIPNTRKAELEATIFEKFSIPSDQLTADVLEKFINIECVVESEGYVPHGLKVVQHYQTNGDVLDLEREWRQHFLDIMSPKHLPDLWSVNYVRD